MRHRKHVETFSLFSFQDIITSVTGVLILLTLFLALQIVHSNSLRASTAHQAPDAKSRPSIEQIDQQIKQLQQALRNGQQFLAEFASLSPASLQKEKKSLASTIERLTADNHQFEADIASTQLEEDALSAAAHKSSNEKLASLQAKLASLTQQLESLKAANRIVYNVAPNEKKKAWLVDLSTDAIRVARPGSWGNSKEFVDSDSGRAIRELLAWASGRDAVSEYFVLLVRPRALTKYRRAYEGLDKLGFAIGVDLLEQNATLVNLSDQAVQ